ncbi:flagellar transcriptional regulator FlhD [Ralstonia solanacearum]|nr:flagellar transcriptional regulator FlhD [Ralstonia solanacearum]MDC6179982.1 flagellar transcriptional regulator FlhD [Ralstonia solanacearum]MDC6239627.1 flagellar transcriptional regulator FlhD [Ralstonia solanacearum]TYZ56085.1 flagellar transcriptional regulator FlhD [Ralstonia solanacearum]
MEGTPLLSEIRALNSAYLRLARRMLATDHALATSALGISQPMGEALLALDEAACVRMAQTNLFLCRIHFDDRVLAALLTGPRMELLECPVSAGKVTAPAIA